MNDIEQLQNIIKELENRINDLELINRGDYYIILKDWVKDEHSYSDEEFEEWLIERLKE